MPRQWFLKSIDPDGKRTASDVYKEVYKLSSIYYDLVVTSKESGEGLYYFSNALEIYYSFVWITLKSTWGKYPSGCTCRDNSTDYLCDHVLLTCAAFDETVQVPTNWVA